MPRKNPERVKPVRRSKKWKRRQRKTLAQGRLVDVAAGRRQ